MGLGQMIKNFFPHKKKVVVIVQCRLSSTRLNRKALKPLGGKTVLDWNLASMKKVKADDYYVATDESSFAELEPIAKNHGFKIFAGSLEDVLDRFCKVIELSKADVVVRATADNPFLFYEAANDLVEEYFKREKNSPVDYITYSNLPHGSGIEIFNAQSLLEAAVLTDVPYDHEHVGPSLYNYQKIFKCKFKTPPERYNHPKYRTTIDTAADYRRALLAVDEISGTQDVVEPYTTEQIVDVFAKPFIKYPVLLVPSVKKGHGTGHLRRCLDLAIKNKWFIYISNDADLTERWDLIDSAVNNGLRKFQIVDSIDDAENYSMIVTDMFMTDKKLLEKLTSKTSVVCLDEGNENTDSAEYVLDIIPTVSKTRTVNYSNPFFIPLPENKKSESEKEFKKALVVFGGEDPASLTLPASRSLAENGLKVTAVVSSQQKKNELAEKVSDDIKGLIDFVLPIENLKEKLYEYDLVFTHFGFTAFEASGAGCAVILAATTSLHGSLAAECNFKCLSLKEINSKKVGELLKNKSALYKKIESEKKESLSDYLIRLSCGNHFSCPVCGKKEFEFSNKLIARTKDRTFRRCSECGMIYISWTVKEKQTEYNHAYFFEDYQKQYGKTYLDDFDSIKKQCTRRISNISLLYKLVNKTAHVSITPSVLDIGCAMGPFLSAASDYGWQVFGADISSDAIDYVQHTLKFPAVCAPFPGTNFSAEFGIEKFDAVTMWYVIEHFQNLSKVLESVGTLVKKDGIFAFSTPSASGISGKYNRRIFFEQSPSDHFSVWETDRASSILKRFGFKVIKVVPTGIHPERLPFVKKHHLEKNALVMKLLNVWCRFFKLGDTVEIYCRKI